MIYPEEHLNRLKEIMILPVIEKLNLNPEDEPTFWKEFNKQLKENFGFCYQQRMDETHSAVRFCTRWATKEENVDALIAAL